MSDQGSNKRRQARLQFTSQCLLEVESPAWAMSSQEIEGETVNITTHGMRLNIPGFAMARARRWKQAIDNHERINVRLRIPLEPVQLAMTGQVVWFDFEETDSPDTVLACAGVLFAILRESEAKLLRRLVDSIDTQDGT